MAKSKKTKKEVIDDVVKLEPMGEIKLAESKKLENCEWCFQFDEDEPQVFAWTGEGDNLDEEPKVIFTITNTENSYITFTHKNGKSFKLFARELTDEGKQLRAKQIELTKSNLENESTNKEA
jgi:hypothetical protein